jgi:hypothetical protein
VTNRLPKACPSLGGTCSPDRRKAKRMELVTLFLDRPRGTRAPRRPSGVTQISGKRSLTPLLETCPAQPARPAGGRLRLPDKRGQFGFETGSKEARATERLEPGSN